MNKKATAFLCFLLLNSFFIALVEGNLAQSLELVQGRPPWLLNETASTITILDDAEERVTIKKDIKTIIAIGTTYLYVTIRALKSEDKVVGISDWICKQKIILPVMANITNIVQTAGTINYEKIYEINPDVVVMISPFVDKEINAKLASNIPVIKLKHNNLKSIAKLGKVLDREREAKEYVNWIISKTSVIEKKTSLLEKDEIKEVFFYYGGESGISPPPPYGTYGKDNFWVNDSIKKSGGKSISWTLPGEWITVDPEWIIEKNPFIIIREFFVSGNDPAMGYDVNDTTKIQKMMERLVSRPAFVTSDAVKNKNVYICSGMFIQSYWFIGLNYYAKWLHPALFKNIYPEAVHQEFLTKFLRLDYNLKQRGVFSYSDR